MISFLPHPSLNLRGIEMSEDRRKCQPPRQDSIELSGWQLPKRLDRLPIAEMWPERGVEKNRAEQVSCERFRFHRSLKEKRLTVRFSYPFRDSVKRSMK